MSSLVVTAIMVSGLYFFGCESDSSDLRAKVAISSPTNGQTDVDIDKNLTVTFNAEARPESISIQSLAGPCGTDSSIWLSSNDFETCSGSTVSFIDGTENRKIELVPFPALNPSTLYKLKIRDLVVFANAPGFEETNLEFTTK